MVKLKSANRNSKVIPPQKRRSFSSQQLFWFILASLIVHGLGLLVAIKYRASKPISPEPTEQKPIEFVVVPEESEAEPPPETNNRAAENSLAEPELEPAETTDPNPSSPEPPQEQVLAESEPIAPPPEPEPEPEPIAPPPEPEPEPIAPPPEPEPEPEPIAPPPEPEPEPEESKSAIEEQTPVLSGSDSAAPPITQTEPPETESPTTSSSPPENEPESEPVPEPVPEPELPETTAALPPQDDNSASSLLGGSYKKTLADGGDAFFSPEALEYNSVLNPAQLSALKDIDLSQYIAAMEQRVRPNWNPRHRVDDRSTVLTFDIQKNGQITGLRVTRSSGLADVDRASLEAVQKSAPFPPLPPEFPLESLEITFSFNIHIY